MRRTLYIDGFNFYYGVTSYWSHLKGLAGLGWCDFRALVERHFPASGDLRIKYFTAPITENVELRDHRPGEHHRYSLWRRALRTMSGLTVIEGFYKRTDPHIQEGLADRREEKQTDVNLAVEALLDTLGSGASRPEHVFLLTGDCDEIPVVFALQERLPVSIPVTVLLPSRQKEEDWIKSYQRTRKRLLKNNPSNQAARVSGRPATPVRVKVLDEEMLANSLLKYSLRDSEGEFQCPHYWKLSSEYLDQWCRHPAWRPDRSIT